MNLDVAVSESRGDAPLYTRNATDLRQLIAGGSVSAVEVMTSFLDRIEAVNPSVNAICTLVSREEAMRR